MAVVPEQGPDKVNKENLIPPFIAFLSEVNLVLMWKVKTLCTPGFLCLFPLLTTPTT